MSFNRHSALVRNYSGQPLHSVAGAPGIASCFNVLTSVPQRFRFARAALALSCFSVVWRALFASPLRDRPEQLPNPDKLEPNGKIQRRLSQSPQSTPRKAGEALILRKRLSF